MDTHSLHHSQTMSKGQYSRKDQEKMNAWLRNQNHCGIWCRRLSIGLQQRWVRVHVRARRHSKQKVQNFWISPVQGSHSNESTASSSQLWQSDVNPRSSAGTPAAETTKNPIGRSLSHHNLTISQNYVVHFEKVSSNVRQKLGRQPGDDMPEIDVNTMIWGICPPHVIFCVSPTFHPLPTLSTHRASASSSCFRSSVPTPRSCPSRRGVKVFLDLRQKPPLNHNWDVDSVRWNISFYSSHEPAPDIAPQTRTQPPLTDVNLHPVENHCGHLRLLHANAHSFVELILRRLDCFLCHLDCWNLLLHHRWHLDNLIGVLNVWYFDGLLESLNGGNLFLHLDRGISFVSVLHSRHCSCTIWILGIAA